MLVSHPVEELVLLHTDMRLVKSTKKSTGMDDVSLMESFHFLWSTVSGYRVSKDAHRAPQLSVPRAFDFCPQGGYVPPLVAEYTHSRQSSLVSFSSTHLTWQKRREEDRRTPTHQPLYDSK